MGIAASITNMCFPVAPPGVSVPTNVPDVVTRHFDDISIHVVNTGWVRVKTAHRSYDGPAALRFPAIAFGRQWTELMPVLVTVIEHAEGYTSSTQASPRRRWTRLILRATQRRPSFTATFSTFGLRPSSASTVVSRR